MHPIDRRANTAPPQLVADLLREGFDVRLRLAGWSMKPLVPPGSVVRFSAGEPTLGDVVLLRRADKLVAHRVIAFDGDRVWTKGDSCTSPDGVAERSQILGCARSLDSVFGIPLQNRWMRGLGLLLSRVYPPLVRGFRTLVPRKAPAV